MDMIEAAKETLELARSHSMDSVSWDEKPSLEYNHLVGMYEKMSSDPTMSEAKVGRWLGWMQAAVVACCDGVTLEHMKQINMRWAG